MTAWALESPLPDGRSPSRSGSGGVLTGCVSPTYSPGPAVPVWPRALRISQLSARHGAKKRMDSAWLYVVIGIVALAVLYFAFFRKPAEQLPPAEKKAELTSPKAAEKAAEATKALTPAKGPGAPAAAPSAPE